MLEGSTAHDVYTRHGANGLVGETTLQGKRSVQRIAKRKVWFNLLKELAQSYWGQRNMTHLEVEDKRMKELSKINEYRCLKTCSSEGCEAPLPLPYVTEEEKGNESKRRRHLKSTFLSANERKAFSAKNVTRLPNVISLLTCEWGALQQLAHQNPLDLTLVAITRHIKAVSVRTFFLPSFFHPLVSSDLHL